MSKSYRKEKNWERPRYKSTEDTRRERREVNHKLAEIQQKISDRKIKSEQ